MNLLKYNTISNDLLWGDVLGAKEFLGQGKAPAVDISEQLNEWIFHFDIPGFKEEDTKIEVHGNHLAVTTTRSDEREQNPPSGYYYTEHNYGQFKRHFTLPDNFDPDNIRAGSKDGVLTITVGKIDLPQPKSITIQKS